MNEESLYGILCAVITAKVTYEVLHSGVRASSQMQRDVPNPLRKSAQRQIADSAVAGHGSHRLGRGQAAIEGKDRPERLLGMAGIAHPAWVWADAVSWYSRVIASGLMDIVSRRDSEKRDGVSHTERASQLRQSLLRKSGSSVSGRSVGERAGCSLQAQMGSARMQGRNSRPIGSDRGNRFGDSSFRRACSRFGIAIRAFYRSGEAHPQASNVEASYVAYFSESY